jgi:hypothetical protein
VLSERTVRQALALREQGWSIAELRGAFLDNRRKKAIGMAGYRPCQFERARPGFGG